MCWLSPARWSSCLLLCCGPARSGRAPLSAPWDIEEPDKSCFIVCDSNGQALAYVYFKDEPGRRTAANLLTRDEARRKPRPLSLSAGAKSVLHNPVVMLERSETAASSVARPLNEKAPASVGAPAGAK
jgi:hypothetical protein